MNMLDNYIDEKGFSHLGRNFIDEANIYLCYVNLLIFAELQSSELITNQMKMDISTYTNRVLPWMQTIFKRLVQTDEKLPAIFLCRLEKML